MRPEDLYDAFHEIDDDLLKPLPEAAPRRHPALRWGALAACALLAAGGLALAAAVGKDCAAAVAGRPHAGE